jgi:hypothetical protein
VLSTQEIGAMGQAATAADVALVHDTA